MFVGLLIIMAIILIKYKPMYSVKIGSKTIGYINENQNINNYIEEIISSEQNQSIAFIEMKEDTKAELQLVSRNINSCDDEVKNKIKDNLSIEYTTYAITYNGKNIAYVSSMDEAEKLVQNIQEEYSSKHTKNMGILQVYSSNYSEIEAIELDKAVAKVVEVADHDDSKKVVGVAALGDPQKDVSKTTNKTVSTASSKSNVNGISLSKPLSGTITSRFGSRTSPGGIGSTNHKGLDISAKTGTTIKAAASGTVTYAGYKGSLGNLVIINNGNGVETYYGHCSKLYVSKGQKVKAGEKIAAVGQTGAATGPHLHFEIHVNGIAVNPQKYLYK